MPLRAARVGRVGVIGAPVAKTAVVAAAVTPGPSPVAKTAVVAAAVTPGRAGRCPYRAPPQMARRGRASTLDERASPPAGATGCCATAGGGEIDAVAVAAKVRSWCDGLVWLEDLDTRCQGAPEAVQGLTAFLGADCLRAREGGGPRAVRDPRCPAGVFVVREHAATARHFDFAWRSTA